jgi:hypothetical protein
MRTEGGEGVGRQPSTYIRKRWSSVYVGRHHQVGLARSCGSHLVVASHVHRMTLLRFSGGIPLFSDATGILPATSGVPNKWHITIIITTLRDFY